MPRQIDLTGAPRRMTVQGPLAVPIGGPPRIVPDLDGQHSDWLPAEIRVGGYMRTGRRPVSVIKQAPAG
jgi:hypothetical protein